MRTARIALAGQEHLLCFSLRVIRQMVERYGALEQMDAQVTTEDEIHNLDEALWQLAAMMEAGDRYAKRHGIDNPAPLDVEALYDLCGIADLADLRAKVRASVRSGSAATVEAEFPPNAGATQGAP